MDKIRTYLKSSITGPIIISVISTLVLLVLIFSVFWYNREKLAYYVLTSKSLMDERGKDITLEESLVVDTVKKVSPAVVSISISKNVSASDEFFGGDGFFNFPLPLDGENNTQKREIGGGSGFLITTDGYIVTNRHVVDDENATYTVYTNDGKKREAKIVAEDPSLDIAIIKISGSNYSYLTLGDSNSLEVGQSVIAIGNALGEFRNTVSTGVISGLGRSIVAGDFTGSSELVDQAIQTDAAINFGNSGGPLVNLKGEVIGMNVAVAQGSQNVGFALPSNNIKVAIDSVRQSGRIIRPYIGLRYMDITPDIKERDSLPVDYGALVIKGGNSDEPAVIAESPADKAGIKEGDIILEIDKIRLSPDKSLSSVIRSKSVGDQITLLVLREGKNQEIKVILEETK